jgi:hypothetical protein
VKLLHDIWTKLVFAVGDLRGKKRCPWFLFDDGEPAIPYEEAYEAMALVQPGDIGLHREYLCASNLAIPGYMKHAWIHLNAEDDCTRNEIVEAVSEGVLRRSAQYPIMAKHTIILRPRVSEHDKRKAILKAKKIVGAKYDVDFRFDIEDELHEYNERNGFPWNTTNTQGGASLKAIQKNMTSGYTGFTCTEAVCFAYWHVRHRLSLNKTYARGKLVVLADQMINPSFDIVWCSKAVNWVDALNYGVSTEGVEMIRKFKKGHK